MAAGLHRLSGSCSSYRPIESNETGKITRGGDKKMMIEGLEGVLGVWIGLCRSLKRGSAGVETTQNGLLR